MPYARFAATNTAVKAYLARHRIPGRPRWLDPRESFALITNRTDSSITHRLSRSTLFQGKGLFHAAQNRRFGSFCGSSCARCIPRNCGMGIAIKSKKTRMKERGYGHHRPTHIADINNTPTVKGASEARLRVLGSDREGQRGSPRGSRHDRHHRVPRTPLEKLDTAGPDTWSHHSDHHYRDIRDSILRTRQKEIEERRTVKGHSGTTPGRTGLSFEVIKGRAPIKLRSQGASPGRAMTCLSPRIARTEPSKLNTMPAQPQYVLTGSAISLLES